ncbi:MAG: hypothetical protein ABUL72_05735 [Armatimonadota bacterium]
MLMSEAQKMVGKVVAVSYRDRSGEVSTNVVEVFDVSFIAMFGPCLVTDQGEIRLDRLVAWMPSLRAA